MCDTTNTKTIKSGRIYIISHTYYSHNHETTTTKTEEEN